MSRCVLLRVKLPIPTKSHQNQVPAKGQKSAEKTPGAQPGARPVPFQCGGRQERHVVCLSKFFLYVLHQTNPKCIPGHRIVFPPPRGGAACLPLKVWYELANGDLLRHLLVEVMAIEHHRFQNGQGPLQD